MGRMPECREDHGWSRATIVHGRTGVAKAMDRGLFNLNMFMFHSTCFIGLITYF